MDFRTFFKDCEFKLLAVGDCNWDYYTMQYQNEGLSVVALAKEGTGCSDSCFGDIKYFKKFNKTNGKLKLTDYAKGLLGLE